MMRGKKGAEKYLSPWIFLIWGLIALMIVIGVLIFYSAKGGDIRAEEAEILAIRIADCIVDNGYLNEEISKFNIFEKCGLDEKMFKESVDSYFNISIFDFNSGNLVKEPITFGDKSLIVQCEIKKEEQQFAECRSKTVYALNQSNKFIIKVTAASNQLGSKLS